MNFQLEKNYIFKINNIKMNISYFATIAHCLINFNNAIFPTDQFPIFQVIFFANISEVLIPFCN